MARRSPQSINYLVYGIGTRGVIGIDAIGELQLLDVDKTGGNHYHATYMIGQSLGASLNYNLKDIENLVKSNIDSAGRVAYKIGIDVANSGITIFQLEGDELLAYLPAVIDYKQAFKILEVMVLAKNLTWSIAKNDDVEYLSTQDLAMEVIRRCPEAIKELRNKATVDDKYNIEENKKIII